MGATREPRPRRAPSQRANKRTALLATALLCGGGRCLAAPVGGAPAESPTRFDIPAQALAPALDQFARQAGVQILYSFQIAALHRSAAVRGPMPAREALDRLLRGSGLQVARFADRVVILRIAPRGVPPAPPLRAARLRRPAAPSVPAARPAPPPASVPSDIVVTGRAAESPLADTQSSYAVTRIGSAALARRGPISTAELFKDVPGFWVEASGGEASNNVRSRGIPTDGYSSVALLEDGLPVQYDGGLGYLNTDQVFRIDSTIDHVEAVRGGPSAVFTANGPGGSVNFITRNGLSKPGLSLSTTLADFGYERIDGFAGVRIGPHLGVLLGGFFRRDRGLRNPGYPADVGGQVRAGVNYDDGRLSLAFNAKHLDDRVILYLPVPLAVDGRGQIRAIPGFDPLFDTLAGPDNVHVAFKTPAGPQDFDLSQGTHSRVTFYTLDGRLALGDRSALEIKSRLRTGSTLRNALFPIGQPTSGSDYIDSVLPQLAAAFPTMAAAQLRYADTGTPFAPNANGNGLVLEGNLLSVWMPMREAVVDARLTSQVERWGHHDLALGITYADTRLDYQRRMGTVLVDVRGQAQRLDVLAVDADGRQAGALTDNGFVRYGSLFDQAALRPSNAALYLADEWRLSPRWRIDLGARWERTRILGSVEGAEPVDLGDAGTLADDAVLTGNGVVAPIDRHFAGFNWTTGINFQPRPSTGAFFRFTRISRLPSATEFSASPDRTDEGPVPITMAEAGLLAEHRHWTLSAVAFRTHFARLPFTDFRFDAATSSYVERTSIADTSTTGLELAGHADLTRALRVDAQATLQDARYHHFAYLDLGDGVPAVHDLTGNQLLRVPKLALRVTPRLNLLGGKLGIATEFTAYTARFADIANTQRLPPFSLVNVDVNVQLAWYLALALHATNVANALGLTEGNPRAGSFDVSGMGNSYFLARPEFGRAVRATLSLAY